MRTKIFNQNTIL